MNQLDAELFQCPGESHPISAAVHYSRLTRFYPACRDCQFRDQTGTLAKHVVRQLLQTWQRTPAGQLWNSEGLAGVYLNALTGPPARRAAYAFGVHLRQTAESSTTIVIAHDGRPLAAELIEAVSEGVRHAGCDVVDMGSATAGSLTFAIQHFEAGGGLYVGNTLGATHTLSIKFWGPAGRPLSADGDLDDVRLMSEQQPGRPIRKLGRLHRSCIDTEYLTSLREHFQGIRPLRVRFDTSCQPLEQYVRELSRNAACLFLPPRKINGKPDTRQLQPHFGIVIDGDGETCTVSDELGRPIDSDDLLPVLARLLITAELPLEAETAATIVLEEGTPARAADAIMAVIEAAGGRVVLSKPSRQAMDTAMRDHDAVLGGGSSGRFWFRGPTPTADALVLLTHLLRILSQSDRPMSEVMQSK